MVKPRDLLILKYEDFRTEVSSFFKELNKDPELRNVFFMNPSLVLRTKLPSLNGINVSDQQDELANRILFSVLSNDRFKTFLKEYQEKKNNALTRFLKSPEDGEAASELDERTIRMEFAEALLQFGDKELLSNLLGSSNSITQPAAWGWMVAVLLIAVAVAVAIRLALTLGISGDFAPTTPGELPISAPELRKIAEQLVATAKQVREAGDLIP